MQASGAADYLNSQSGLKYLVDKINNVLFPFNIYNPVVLGEDMDGAEQILNGISQDGSAPLVLTHLVDWLNNRLGPVLLWGSTLGGFACKGSEIHLIWTIDPVDGESFFHVIWSLSQLCLVDVPYSHRLVSFFPWQQC